MSMDPLQQALTLHRSGNLPLAERAYRHVLANQPNNARAVYLLGLTFAQRGMLPGAVECWRRAIALKPDYVEAYSNLGAALGQLKQTDGALLYLRRAVELDPRSAAAHNNLASTLSETDQPDEAIEHFRRAVELKPDYFDALFNLAKLTQRQGDIRGAGPLLDRAVSLKPEDPEARFLRGMNLLLLGDLPNGLRDYEARTRCKDFTIDPRQLPGLPWEGQDPAGKTILLHAEQGLGDTIQFARYAPLLGQRGARVLLEVQPPLVSVMRTLDGIERVIARGDALPGFDLQASLLSLPRLFATTNQTIPANVPYLVPDPQRLEFWRHRLEGSPRPRVGFVLAGNPRHTNDRNRSMPPEQFRAFLKQVEGVSWFSLQKDRAEPIEGTLDYTPDLHDFMETAALVTQLDLVVSVDTSVAHLAGALAKPVWLLLPFVPEWRWQLDRSDSPWYPTMRIFRQGTRGDWSGLLGHVAQELARLRQQTESPT
jgi:Flp pilus assembly protein TadD